MSREEFKRWRREGSDLLAKLEAELSGKLSERDLLTAEIEGLRADIAEMRSSLPLGTPRVGGPETANAVLQKMAAISEATASRTVRVAPDATVIDAVRAVLAMADRPLTARTVFVAVRAHGNSSSPSEVHRALYRLKGRGEVEVTGERPNSAYALRPQAEAQTAISMS